MNPIVTQLFSLLGAMRGLLLERWYGLIASLGPRCETDRRLGGEGVLIALGAMT